MSQYRSPFRVSGTNMGICLLAYVIMTVIGFDVLVLARVAGSA